MKKYLILTLMHVLLMMCLIGSSAFKTVNIQANFSGTWRLNMEKSKFGQVPSVAAAQQYQVEQNKKEIALKWIAKNQNNEDVSSSQKLQMDGTPEKALLPSQVTRTMKVSIDPNKNTLIFNMSYSKPNSPGEADYELTEVWSMSEDGKTLIVELKSPGYTITAVYDKVE
jgi:preprotein translocase subunit SecF